MPVTPVDTSSFTDEQKRLFGEAAALGSGVPTFDDSDQEAIDTGVDDLGLPIRNYEQYNPQGYNNSFISSSGGGSSVMASENALTKIPKLNAMANTLPFYDLSSGGTQDTFQEPGESYDTDAILGINESEERKRRRMEEQYKNFEGKAGWNLPHGYWETVYGEEAPYFRELAEMRKTSDRVAQEQMALIQSRFDQRRAEQEAINARGIAGINQVLNLGGTSRYAPLTATGIVSAAESEGLKRLTNIDTEERNAISEIRIAQQNKDYELMETKLEALEAIRSEKSKAMSDLATDIQKTELQVERENAMASLIAQGITDPLQIFQKLNAQGINMTIKDVGDALKNFGTTGGGAFKFETKQVGPLLGMGFSMQDIQQMQDDFNAGQSIESVLQGVPPEMQSAVRAALGISATDATNIRPGVGAADVVTEQMIRTRLFPKAATILNKGTLSDADRKIIDERIAFFRDSGLSEQQILDVFSGWSADISTPFNDSFRNVILATQEKGEGVSQELNSLGSLLRAGNYVAAMNRVENTALDTVKGQDGYVGKIVTENYTKKIDRIKQILKQGGVWNGTGPLEGTFSNLVGRFKGKDAAKLKAELTALYADFRRTQAGTAVTETELNFLEPLFADVTDKKGNFLEKLDAFQRSVLDGHNATRRTVSLPEVDVADILSQNERLYRYMQQETSSGVNTYDI